MNKEEIKAVLAIINRQCFVGVNREAIENHLEYRLLRSAATKLERMLLDIESGYNKLVNAENARKGAGMNKPLHPHEIQIAIFSQLLTCETLLKPEYKMRIDRCCNGTFLVYILRTDEGKTSTLFCWKLERANISTSADVEENIRLFWDDVPNQYKKMKTPKRKHNDTFLSWGDEYYNKLSQQIRGNLPVLTHTIPYSESKPKSVAELQNETWYYIKAKHTCNGMFLVDGCGGPYIELNNYRVRNCVYTPQAIKEQHRINPPATIDLTFALDDRTGETKAKLIEALAAHKQAESGQQTELPTTGGQQDRKVEECQNG